MLYATLLFSGLTLKIKNKYNKINMLYTTMRYMPTLPSEHDNKHLKELM